MRGVVEEELLAVVRNPTCTHFHSGQPTYADMLPHTARSLSINSRAIGTELCLAQTAVAWYRGVDHSGLENRLWAAVPSLIVGLPGCLAQPLLCAAKRRQELRVLSCLLLGIQSGVRALFEGDFGVIVHEA